jgi:hypothetical protein
MTTAAVVEVARERWAEELETFTAVHEGWLVTLQVFRSDEALEFTNLTLLGVSADRHGDGRTIAVSAAKSDAEHVTRIIHDVTRLYVERTIDGTTSGLFIESGDGIYTVLQFRTATAAA